MDLFLQITHFLKNRFEGSANQVPRGSLLATPEARTKLSCVAFKRMRDVIEFQLP
jgi:hypothetical protein